MTTHQSAGSTTDNGSVDVRQSHGVSTVSFRHPKGNSLPGSLLSQLAEAIARAGTDAASRVIVLRSEGPGAFCAGASFDELLAIHDAAAGREFFSGFARVILAMIRSPKFVIARVHGKATGGGIGLIAAADYAVAVPAAAVKLSELAIGIGPFVVGPAIERKIGAGAFTAMSVDADWRDAGWCERHGLYARVVADATELDTAVDRLAGTLAASSPEAMARLKQLFRAGTDDWDHLLAVRAEMSGTLVLSPFTRDAIDRFRSR